MIKQQQSLQDIIKFNMESSPVDIAHTIFDKMQQVGPWGQLTGGGLYVLAAMCDESLKPVLEAISPHLENTMSVLRPWKDSIQEWAGIIAGGGSLATMPAMVENSTYHRSPFGVAAATYISTLLLQMMTHPERAAELGKLINLGNWAWNITRNMGECDPKVPRHKPVFNGSITQNVLDIIPTTIFFANKEMKRFGTYGLQPLQHYIAEKATIAGTRTSQIKNPFNKVAAAATKVAGSIANDIKRIVVPPRIHTYHASDAAETQYITDAAKFSALINALAIGSTVVAHTTNNPAAITVAQLFAISTAVATSVQGRVKLLPAWDLAGKCGGVGQALLLGGVEAPGLALTFLSYYLFSKGNAAMLGKQGKDSR